MSAIAWFPGFGRLAWASQNPSSQSHSAAQALQLFKSKNYWDAAAAFKAILDRNPGWVVGWYYHGICELRNKRVNSARNSFEQIAQTQGKWGVFATIQIARIHEAENDLEQAASTLGELSKRTGDGKSKALVKTELNRVQKKMTEIGLQLYEYRDYDLAVWAFEEVRKYGFWPDAEIMLGLALYQVGDLVSAERQFRELLKLDVFPEYKESARKLIEKIEKDEILDASRKRRPYLSATVLSGWDSNALKVKEPSGSIKSTVVLTAGINKQLSRQVIGGVAYELLGNFHHRFPDNRYVRHSVLLPVLWSQYYRSFQANGSFAFESLGSKAFANSLEGFFEYLEKSQQVHWGAQAFVSYRFPRSAFFQTQGLTLEAGPKIEIIQSAKRWSFNLSYLYSRLNDRSPQYTSGIPLSFDGVRAAAGLTFVDLLSRFDFSPSVSGTYRKYRSLPASEVSREELDLSLSGEFSYRINPAVRILSWLEYGSVGSNFRTTSYDPSAQSWLFQVGMGLDL